MTCIECGRHSESDDPRPSLLVIDALCGRCWIAQVLASDGEVENLLENA